MKLYFTTGACSLSPHIVLCESELNFTLEAVDLKTKKTATGRDFLTINPKGQVPTLALDNGVILTEGPAILQYIADQVPHKSLLAPLGDILRYQTISWLNYIATELHKNYSPLFNPASSAESKAQASQILTNKLHYVDSILHKQRYIAADHFTLADAYLFTILGWRKAILNLPPLPAIDNYMAQLKTRPSIEKALSQEKA